DIVDGRVGSQLAGRNRLREGDTQGVIIDDVDALERLGRRLVERRQIQTNARERAPDIANAGFCMEAMIETPQIIELLGQTFGQREARTRPVIADALFRIIGEVTDELGDQLALAAEVMVDVAPCDADDLSDVSKIERIAADENIVLAGHELDALASVSGLRPCR